MGSRYVSIAPADNPAVANRIARPKRSIPKRSKTGCLTCRARRVKCDEQYPVCRNCQKSKRECTPCDSCDGSEFAAQRPAKRARLSSAALPTPPASSSPPNHTPDPCSFDAFDSFINISPRSADMSSVEQPQPTPIQQIPSEPRMSLTPIPQQEAAHTPHSDGSENKSKPELVIHDLYMINGKDPPTPDIPQPLPPETLEEIKYMFANEYAVGIDQFLETDWFSTFGQELLLQDQRLCARFAGMLDLMASKDDNYEQTRKIPNLEAQVVWHLMGLARMQSSNTNKPPTSAEKSTQLKSVADRIDVLEHLLTGRRLQQNPYADVSSSSQDTEGQDDMDPRMRTFWHKLALFTTLDISSTSVSAETLKTAHAVLANMRAVLDESENRDVLYSMAVVRLLGPRTTDFERGASLTRDNEAKFMIAKKFIEDEAMGYGTTQAVQRMCGMAMRSWNSFR